MTAEPFTACPNRLLEALARAPIGGRAMRVMISLVRLLPGWHKRSDWISSGQIANLTSVSPGHVREILGELEALGMIIREPGKPGRSRRIGLQMNPTAWASAPRKRGASLSVHERPENGAPLAAGGTAPKLGQNPPRDQGTPKKERNLPQTHTDVRVPDVAKAWPEIQKAFAAYGTPPPRDLTRKRRRLIEARLMEHLDRGLECLARAVHGYWATAAPANGDWDPKRGSTVRNVFKPENFPDYLDAFDSALAAGAAPPFRTKPQPSEARTAHGAIVARREAIEGLYRKGLLERPDEAAARAWEARGRPTEPAWWDPEGLAFPRDNPAGVNNSNAPPMAAHN